MNQQIFMNAIRATVLAALAAIPGFSCTYSVSVPAIPAAGGYAYISVNTQANCVWTVSQSSSFMTFANSRSGDGPGAVLVYARPNPGAARSALVNVNAGGAVVVSPPLGTRSAIVATGGAMGPLVARTTAVQY